MLIRQLQKPGDYRRAVLVQDETLRLAIANDENVAAARKNMTDGIIPEPTLIQKRSRAEQQTESSNAKQTAYANLASVLPSTDLVEMNNNVNKFLSVLKTDNEIEFLNFYWDDIKRELEQRDVSRMSVAIFNKILQKVMRENTAQAGLSTQTSLAAESASLNEVNELMQVLPSRETISKIASRLGRLRQDLSGYYRIFTYLIPDKSLQDALNAAAPAVRQEIIENVMTELRNIEPRTAYWNAILSIRQDENFIRQAADSLPIVDEPKVFREYNKVSPNYFRISSRAEMRPQPIPFIPPPRAVRPPPRSLSPARSNVTPQEPKTQMDKALEPKRRYGRGIKSGKGIAPQPRLLHDLGKYIVDGTELEKQILSIKYQSGAPVPDFGRKIPISDRFQELLKDLIETQKLNKSLMKELDPTERRAIETILIKSGVGLGLGIKEITPTDEDKEKMQRFQLLQGSFNAGNNSQDLIHELRSLVIYFMNSGRLSKKDAISTLQALV